MEIKLVLEIYTPMEYILIITNKSGHSISQLVTGNQYSLSVSVHVSRVTYSCMEKNYSLAASHLEKPAYIRGKENNRETLG